MKITTFIYFFIIIVLLGRRRLNPTTQHRFFELFKKKNVFIFHWLCLKIHSEYEDKYNKFVYFYDMYILTRERCFFSNWWKSNIIMILFFKNYSMGTYTCEECLNITKSFTCGHKNIWLHLCISGEKFVWLPRWDGILNMNWFLSFFFSQVWSE